LIFLFVLLICASSSSPSPQVQPSFMRSRRLLSTQCRDASSCSTPLSGLSRFFKAPATVFESLKKMPKSSGSLVQLVHLVQDSGACMYILGTKLASSTAARHVFKF
ncbi:hypothetical protein BAE44_0013908, partial [Dichanthelium oligosanthes]